LGGAEKKIAGSGRARRVPEGRLASPGRREDRRAPLGVRGRDGGQRLFVSAVRGVAQGREGLRQRAALELRWGKNVTLLASIMAEGTGPCLAVEGSTTRGVFETYLERVLAELAARAGVVVMDNLSAHKKGGRVREIVEGRGCELLYLPPYSPDLNPIEQAFSKVKGSMRKAEARTREALIGAMGQALNAVTAKDVRGFFGHCGYRSMHQLL